MSVGRRRCCCIRKYFLELKLKEGDENEGLIQLWAKYKKPTTTHGAESLTNNFNHFAFFTPKNRFFEV